MTISGTNFEELCIWGMHCLSSLLPASQLRTAHIPELGEPHSPPCLQRLSTDNQCEAFPLSPLLGTRSLATSLLSLLRGRPPQKNLCDLLHGVISEAFLGPNLPSYFFDC